jgi:hypothetical protein
VKLALQQAKQVRHLIRTVFSLRFSDPKRFCTPFLSSHALQIESAALSTIAEGKYITRDLGGRASTSEYTKQILKKLLLSSRAPSLLIWFRPVLIISKCSLPLSPFLFLRQHRKGRLHLRGRSRFRSRHCWQGVRAAFSPFSLVTETPPFRLSPSEKSKSRKLTLDRFSFRFANPTALVAAGFPHAPPSSTLLLHPQLYLPSPDLLPLLKSAGKSFPFFLVFSSYSLPSPRLPHVNRA